MKKIIILLLMSFQIMSCQNRTIKVTPKEFLANNIASKQLYSKDSLGLVSLIKKQIKLHEDAYHPSSYDDLTLIIIDSIMYNSDYNKLVFFIITKDENKKSYPKDWDKEKVNSIEKYGNLPYEGYHYNSNTYIGIRENDSLKINNFFRIGFNDFQNIKELKKKQRQTFFEEYAAVKEKGYEYNLNDTRFWDNPNVWDKIKEDEIKWKEFDKLKKEHPEDVYEPKR